MEKTKPQIIIITGPPGAGKSTVSQLLSKLTGIALLQGDKLKDHLFPEISDITQFPKSLAALKQAIYGHCQSIYSKRQSLIVDYVIAGEGYIRNFQEEFGEDLVFKVLLPPREVIYQRDLDRECWTAGKAIIDHLYESFLSCEEIIGKASFVDSQGQLPEKTARIIMDQLIH